MTDIIPFSPSQKLIDEFPEFGKITIYGTSEEPLFPLAQVRDFLNVGIRVDKGEFDDDDYVKVKCMMRDGRAKEQNLLTEYGLYKVLYKTNTLIGKKFRRFTKIIMRELRLCGLVELQPALDKLRLETFTITEKEETGNDLYIMKCLDNYKIGRSSNVEKRRCSLQTGNADEIVLFMVWKNIGKYEFHVHEKAETILTRKMGEWFSGDINPLIMWINQIE